MFSGGILTLPRWRSVLIQGGGVVLIGLLVLVTRLAWLSGQSLREAALARQAGRWDDAFQAYLGSIRSDFPGNPYGPEALRGALSIIDGYHEQGQADHERQALEDLRGVLYSIRSFHQPHAAVLRQVEQRLRAFAVPNLSRSP